MTQNPGMQMIAFEGAFGDSRAEQMLALKDALIDRDESRVVLHGAQGSGKTALVRQFADRYRERFTGGVSFASAIDETTTAQISFELFSRHRPALVVLDSIDVAPVQELSRLLLYLGSEYPRARVLMTSRVQLLATPETLAIEMPPLSLGQVFMLLGSAFPGDPDRLRALADQLAGNAAAVRLISQRLAAGMPPERISDWVESGTLPVWRDAAGRPLEEQAAERRALDLTVTEVSEELIQHLAVHPELLYELDPRKFEQLAAELYRRRGYEATLTPASGDGGVDVYVVSRDGVGETLWVVQAKRWAPHRRVGAGVVRELYGTVNLANASAGVLLTTSFFEPGAQAIKRDLRYRLQLADYLDLQQMLREPPRMRRDGDRT